MIERFWECLLISGHVFDTPQFEMGNRNTLGVAFPWWEFDSICLRHTLKVTPRTFCFLLDFFVWITVVAKPNLNFKKNWSLGEPLAGASLGCSLHLQRVCVNMKLWSCDLLSWSSWPHTHLHRHIGSYSHLAQTPWGKLQCRSKLAGSRFSFGICGVRFVWYLCGGFCLIFFGWTWHVVTKGMQKIFMKFLFWNKQS